MSVRGEAVESGTARGRRGAGGPEEEDTVGGVEAGGEGGTNERARGLERSGARRAVINPATEGR